MRTCLKAILVGGNLLAGGAFLAQSEVVTIAGAESFQEVAKEDKAFLNQAEPSTLRTGSKSPQQKTVPTAPEKVRSETKKTVVQKRVESTPKISKRPAPEASEKRENSRPPRQITIVETRVGPPLISRDEVRDFVDDYLRSIEASSIEEEAQFYADSVNFPGKGSLPKNLLLAQQARQREQWPDRSVYLESRPEVQYLREDEALVTFRKSFLFENEDREWEGENITQLHLKTSPDGTKIVGIQER